jgi:hypothetical protein
MTQAATHSEPRMPTPCGEAAIPGAGSGPGGVGEVVTRLAPAEILARLDTASRRGRLPGFTARPREGILFTLELHGQPFDGLMTASASQTADGGSVLALRWRMRPQLPLLFMAVLIATIWPGVYFMDRLIPGSWTWIPAFGSWWPATWWWYIPLTALPLPFAWRVLMRRSRAALEAAAAEAVEKVRKELA